jgi:hypothetical protein
MSDIRDDRINNLKITGTISGGGIQALARTPVVSMTGAASGSSGITVADDDDIDFGTGNFSIHWEGALPDWTPASETRLFRKNTDSTTTGVVLNILTTGAAALYLINGGVSSTAYSSVTPVGGVDNALQQITAVCVRESASAAGSVTIYANGQPVGAPATITAATPFSLSNSLTAYISGSSAIRTASTTRACYLYNRALSAAEVASLCINGPALADMGASQTAVYTSDFSVDANGVTFGTGVTGTANQDGIGGEDNWLKVEDVSSTDGIGAVIPFVAFSKSGFITVKINNPSGSLITHIGLSAKTLSGQGTVVDGFISAPAGASTVLSLYVQNQRSTSNIVLRAVDASGVVLNVASGQFVYIKDITSKQTGITSELIASNAQSNTGQIFDTSGNKNHAMLPADGATVVGRPVSQTREVRWTNTWAGTNELQYIGGVNQAILPANAYIDSIVGTVSGATPHDIIVGDGSDTDRYVTITTGLAAGTTTFTLASRTTDGTNLKLTVDPDTDATMSIAWVISYKTLES